jgi:prevent-host-death family protein
MLLSRRGVVAKQVSKSEFKPKALAFLRQVEESGEPLVVTDRGRPVVRIEPYEPAADVLERLRGCVVRYDDPLEPVADADWEAAS